MAVGGEILSVPKARQAKVLWANIIATSCINIPLMSRRPHIHILSPKFDYLLSGRQQLLGEHLIHPLVTCDG